MKLIKHNDYIFEYQDLVGPELCDEICDLVFSSYNKNMHFSDNKTKIRKNTSLNLTMLSQYHQNYQRADNIAHEIFSICHQNYIRDNKLLFYLIQTDYIKRLHSEYIFRSYDPTDYYDWHLDITENKQHILSYILYLNDDFDGGNTLFLKEKLKIKPKKGSMLCFPCDFTMLHKSTKIQKGQKNIIWSCFSRIMLPN